MPRLSVEDQLAARVADDPGHDPERRVPFGEDRSLLDVELEEGTWPGIAARDEGAAADASDLLSAKDNNGADSYPLDGFDRRDDPERPIEATAARNRVEVRADPDGVRHSV